MNTDSMVLFVKQRVQSVYSNWNNNWIGIMVLTKDNLSNKKLL